MKSARKPPFMKALLGAAAMVFALCLSAGGEEPLLKAPKLEPGKRIFAESELWKRTPSVKIPGAQELELKALHDEKNVYLLVEWLDDSESRSQSPWIWDAKLKCYRPGPAKEDALTVALFSPRLVDIWVWRAGRSDPAGHADDMHASPASRRIEYDAGTTCWTQTEPPAFAGSPLPRFVQRTPSGSAADVKARGTWAAGKWKLFISRLKDTGNDDDVAIRDGEELPLSLLVGAPGSFDELDAAPKIRIVFVETGK